VPFTPFGSSSQTQSTQEPPSTQGRFQSTPSQPQRAGINGSDFGDNSDEDIDVDTFLDAERRAYDLPPAPVPINFNNVEFLEDQAIPEVDKG
jgi:hypothetical protein